VEEAGANRAQRDIAKAQATTTREQPPASATHARTVTLTMDQLSDETQKALWEE
jgi:hypothetical protein